MQAQPVFDLIVSLTSYPARIPYIAETLKSLLFQHLKPEKIVLVLAPEQFPNKEQDLPQSVLDLLPQGIELLWYHDIKSFKKLIPTLKAYPDKCIVTADDDNIYPSDWLEKLYQAHVEQPQLIHCHRAHLITCNQYGNILPYRSWHFMISGVPASTSLFFTGVGGVLYPPKCFSADILREDLFMSICPHGDDIWFWAMAVLNNTKTSVVPNNMAELQLVDGTQETALWVENLTLNGNDKQLGKLFSQYPELINQLQDMERCQVGLIKQAFNYAWKTVPTCVLRLLLKIKHIIR